MNDHNVTPINKNSRPAFSFFHCFSLYIRLCFFKASPEQLPFNISCSLKALALYCGINLILLDAQTPAFDVLVKIAIELGILLLIVFIGLKITNKQQRFMQTVSALIGVGMVISLFSLPIYYLFTPDFLQTAEISQTMINVTLILLFWNLSVISIIFKRSFEVSTILASVIAFNYLIIFEMVILSLSTGAA